MRFELPEDRARVGWWLFVLVLAGAAAFIAYSFVGLLALGVFGYYATRPIYQRLRTVIGSDGIAAWVTITLVVLPIFVLLSYAGFQLFQQAQQWIGVTNQPLLGERVPILTNEQRRALLSAIENPRRFAANPRQAFRTILRLGTRAVSAIFGALLLIVLALTLSYFLLKNDDALNSRLQELFGGRDTAAYVYATAVDEDLESIFFGNFLFVIVMAVIATIAYGGTNFLAPPGLHVPMVLVLALLTGAASLIPIVVGKIIYLPVVGYLGFQALNSGGGNHLAFVGGALVGYFLVLDILPQTFLQPYITGKQLDMIVMLFAYLLGPVLFGWYGFFLMPILFVLIIEAIRIVLSELVHGEPLTPAVSMGESVGASSRQIGEDMSGGDEGSDDDSATETD